MFTDSASVGSRMDHISDQSDHWTTNTCVNLLNGKLLCEGHSKSFNVSVRNDR